MQSQSLLNDVQYIVSGKKSQRYENGAEKGQETYTETNTQREGTEFLLLYSLLFFVSIVPVLLCYFC